MINYGGYIGNYNLRQIATIIMQLKPDPTASTEALLILCTFPAEGGLDVFMQGLLKSRLAACVNVLPGILSCYHWQGNVEQSDESLLLIKTVSPLFQALESYICRHHPYDVPEIIAIPIARGSQAYLDWLHTSLTDPG